MDNIIYSKNNEGKLQIDRTISIIKNYSLDDLSSKLKEAKDVKFNIDNKFTEDSNNIDNVINMINDQINQAKLLGIN